MLIFLKVLNKINCTKYPNVIIFLCNPFYSMIKMNEILPSTEK